MLVYLYKIFFVKNQNINNNFTNTITKIHSFTDNLVNIINCFSNNIDDEKQKEKDFLYDVIYNDIFLIKDGYHDKNYFIQYTTEEIQSISKFQFDNMRLILKEW